MNSEYLPVFVSNALNENLQWMSRMSAGQADRKRVLAFCRNFRIAGIGDLLLRGLPGEFPLRLHQSARAYADHLRRTDEAGQRTGQSPPFFDAVAAGDLEGAGEIARHAKHAWTRGVEYEEDFLFVEFLMQCFFLGADLLVGERLLGRYEQALQGAEDVRLEVCRALLNKDADSFNETLQHFLSEQRDRFERLAHQGTLAPELLATEGKVCVEGVALVRLAELLELETEEDYLLVPSVTREPVALRFRADAWRSL